MTAEIANAVPPRTTAEVRRHRSPGWIWAVPLAAVGIVVWLVVRQLSAHGIEVTVTFDDAAQMKAGTTPVIYRGIRIGEVSDVALAGDGTKAVVKLRIADAQKKYLRTGTRFYLEGENPSLSDPGSLKALIAGPTIEMLAGGGAAARSFTGLAGEAPKRLTLAVPYRVIFAGPAGDLKPGAPVSLRGFEVGEVTAVQLETEPAAGNVLTAVTLALDPLRFHIEGGPPADGNWVPVLNRTLTALVEHRWRARLAQSPPLIGARSVELSVVADAAPAGLEVSQGMVQIPAAESAGLAQALKAAGQLPIRQIGGNVRAITANLQALTGSPRLQQSIAHLDDALARLDRTLGEAGPKVAPTIQSVHDTVEQLRITASELDSTVRAARSLIGTEPAAPDGSLEPTLAHVSEAARAVRTLAQYLDEHPESLIKGRSR